MKNICKKIVCMIMVIFVVFQSVEYTANAQENSNKKQNQNENKMKFNKKNYNKEDRKKIMKKAMDKLRDGDEITAEEETIISWEYEEMEITLPNDVIEWEIDHEKGIGVNEGIMTISTTVEDSLIYGSETTVESVGRIPTARYADGEGSDYPFRERLVSSFIIPGIKQTTVGKNVCDDMAAQGICCYNGYIFLTAYCGADEHEAVIYVLDVSTKKYITTLLTGELIHAGGIAYANGYLWVGHTGTSNTGYLYYYNFSQIKEAIGYALSNSSITSIDLADYDRGSIKLYAGNKASYVTTYNGYICVGEYMEDESGVGELALYNPSELLNKTVNRKIIATIPENANGALFYTSYNNTYLIINSNYGRTKVSKVYVYSVSGSSLSPTLKHKKTVELPCMVEEAFNYGSATYFVFESAAKEYRYHILKESTIGEVCGLSTNFIYK